MRTQVNVFVDHKEEDSEEFGHRYDNVRVELEYPLLIELFKVIVQYIKHEIYIFAPRQFLIENFGWLSDAPCASVRRVSVRLCVCA